jgi:hypothetical protein
MAAPSAIPLAGQSILRVVTPQQVNDAEKQAQLAKNLEKAKELELDNLANFIRKRFEAAKRARTSSGVDAEMMEFQRAYAGQYDATKLAAIEQFGGSKVFARITASKCRGATGLLRDIYLSSERPWSVSPSPEPRLPGSVERDIDSVVGGEAMYLIMNGAPPEKSQLLERKNQLLEAAKKAELRKAVDQAVRAQKRMDDILTEGKFWHAFSDFLIDLPIYHCAIIKGPTVRNAELLTWGEDGSPKVEVKPRFYWDRVAPQDVWFSPGASSIEKSDAFERQRLSASDLYDLIGLPGYKEDAIRKVIRDHSDGGLREWGLMFEEERRQVENRGNNSISEDPLVDCIEFQGFVLGKHLKEFEIKGAHDPEKPFFVTAWLIDRTVIKVMLNPNIRKRPNYYSTSFDKQPGTIYGAGVAELLADIQDVMNATLRSLVNNLSISSGPQVYVDEERLSPNSNQQLYPWKVWKYTSDPMNPSAQPPVTFFQPSSNAADLLGVYGRFNEIADEVSAIPRYMTGDQKVGGAGRTASGLAMLMGNANKALQNVAENIDDDVFEPLMQNLYDLVMLTDETGMLRGDETIAVNGVRNVLKQEQDRVRQLEFLQLTANEIDAPIIGPQRATVLQQVASRIGIDLDIPEPHEQNSQGPGGGAGFNPAGSAEPQGAVSDGAQPRLQAGAPMNTVSRRNNVA